LIQSFQPGSITLGLLLVMASGSEAQTALEAADMKVKAKTMRTLVRKSTDEEAARSCYDNFKKRGYSDYDIDIAKGEDGLTVKAAVKQAVHNHHVDPKRHKLGSSVYNNIRKTHPKSSDQLGWPDEPVGEVARASLWKAYDANSGEQMRKRGLMIGEIQVLRDSNLTEAIHVCKFFMRLSSKNENMVVEAMAVLDYFVRDAVLTRFPALVNRIKVQVDEMLTAQRKKSKGLNMMTRPWLLRWKKRVELLIETSILDKIMAAPGGRMRTVKSELNEAIKTKIGKELFGQHYEDILNEEVADKISDTAKKDLVAGLITSETMLTQCIEKCNAEVMAIPGIESLLKERKVSVLYCGQAREVLVTSIPMHCVLVYHSLVKTTLLAVGDLEPLWCEQELWGKFKAEFMAYKVGKDVLPGAIIARSLCQSLLVPPFTGEKIRDCLIRKEKDILGEDESFVLESAFWQGMMGPQGAERMVTKLLQLLPSEKKTVSLSTAHQQLLKVCQSGLYQFVDKEAQSATDNITSKVGLLLHGEMPQLRGQVSETTQRLYATLPYFCVSKNAEGEPVRGKEAFQVLYAKIDSVTDLDGLEPLILNAWLGTAVEQAAIFAKKDELIQ